MQEERAEAQVRHQVQLGPSQILLVQAEVGPDVPVGQLSVAQDLLVLMLAQSESVERLALEDQLLLLTEVLDAPELHLELRLVILLVGVLLVVMEAQLVNQSILLVSEVIEADSGAKLLLEMPLKPDQAVLDLVDEALRDGLEGANHCLTVAGLDRGVARTESFVLIELKLLVKYLLVELQLKVDRDCLDVLVL